MKMKILKTGIALQIIALLMNAANFFLINSPFQKLVNFCGTSLQ